MSKLSIDNMKDATRHYYQDTGQKFEMILNGTDAILNYKFNDGMFYGMSVSEIMQTKDGRKLLKWIMLTDSFPRKLRDVIKIHYEEYLETKAKYDKY